MAKSRSRAGSRRLPATTHALAQRDRDPSEAENAMTQTLAHRSSGGGGRAQIAEIPDPTQAWPGEPRYLIVGTGCRAGHEPGAELLGGKLGKVPSRKTTRIGVGLLIWLLFGVVFLSNLLWLMLALIGGASWLTLSAAVQRRSGHRGHCWRSRSWRYAWGGLVPMPRADPTREAD